MKYHTASVCIPASFVKQAKEYVGEKLPICTVIGFPNGYDTTAAKFFTEKPEVLTMEEKKEWIAKNTKVALGSDAFFPFGDNIERAHKSGVEYIAQAGGSVRDDHVIDTCDKYGITMAFTGVRLFHH